VVKKAQGGPRFADVNVMKSRLWASPAASPRATPQAEPRQRWSPLAWNAFVIGLILAVGGAGLGLAGLALSMGPGTRRALLSAVAAAFIAAAASAMLTHRQLVSPLRRLATAAARAVAGEEESGSDATSAYELAPLGPAVKALVDEVDRARGSLLARAILDGASDLTVIIGSDGRIRHASRAANVMLGRPSDWLTGQSFAGLVHPDDRIRLPDLDDGEASLGAFPLSCVELRLSHLQGHWLVTEVSASDLRDDPDVGGVVLNIRDVSVRKTKEEDLLRRALYDPLTGLANRALFREHVEKALARLRRTPALPHAVLFVDLDGFKTVNDSLGHAAGDEVLVEVGNRLRRWMRPGDTAARLGGDEFAVLLENASEGEAGMLAGRILKVLLAPVAVQGKEVVLTGSIGIALSETGEDADELLRNADVAMYTAKAAGKSQFRVFEPAMHHAALRRLDLEADLRRAIDKQELLLTYQPILELATGRITGMEVLVRWMHPTRGLIQPLDFIPLAEDTGLIRPLGRLILEQACRQAKEWSERFPQHRPLRLCVNASVRQVEHPAFYDEVANALAMSGFDGRDLTLEITESLFMNDLDATVEKLSRLKELGLKLAVDDFGTGYSSLSYLRSLPIDILKIDKSFVAGVTYGVEQSAVAQAVVKLARTFNLKTVAEGIEQPEQAAQLLAIGADMGQGYWYSRPLRAPLMEAFLADDLARRKLGGESSIDQPLAHLHS
jgi:diguanylate cyclase (GGDEF)-like protein/PAS domain S-box-containing protein